MPKVRAQGRTFECELGANLRKVLLRHGVDLHNGQSKLINCRGIGSCGTCAVHVVGPVSEVNWRDRTRRSFPPHNSERDLRLACQTRVLGDIRVTKYSEFWGQGSEVAWTPDSV
ncbi:MAG: 2Fe-2S iron-sulfur cluster-binding protein [Cyanobacteria bacterium P01_F01_bin.56]